MSLLTKALGIWAVGKTVSSTTPLFMRLVVGMAAMTLFAVFSAVIFAILIGMLVWLGHGQLIAHGMPEWQAILVISAVLVLMLSILAMVLCHYWMKLSALVRKILYLQAPMAGRVHGLSDAFMSGFNGGNARV